VRRKRDMRQAQGKKGAYLAGIDLGSTSLKCVVYDLSGTLLASGSRPTERFHPDAAHPDWTVWDPARSVTRW
jgi:sugar (pentulose or hexulose) kinase